MNPAYDFKSKLMLRGSLMNWKKRMGPMFQNQVRMHAWHLIINHCIYVFFGSLQEETLVHSKQDCGRGKNHWVDFRTTRREIQIFKTLLKRESPDGIPGWPIYKKKIFFGFWLKEIARRDLIISASNKRNRQIGFQVVWDRQKGSRISILVKGGRQKGPRISFE